MKFLVYGHQGWIGRQWLSTIPSTIELILGKSRVDNTIELEKEISEIRPTHVISFIGRTSGGNFNTIDYLEQPGKLVENIRDNLYGPLTLAILSEKHNFHFTYMGTGCIFSYDKEDDPMYNEDSLPDFFGSSYSTVKGFTDRLMHLYPNVLNVRIRMPITGRDEPKNFISKIIRYKKICSTLNSMTVLPDLLPVLTQWILENKRGTHHLINPGPMNHNEILTLYKEYVEPEFEWENFTEEEQNGILASKRSKNVLDTRELEELGISTLRESLVRLFQNWEK